ncbi:hypothetical protein F3J14_04345 [Burkholderia sp. Tr-862]|uniref:hypothetical protein n=1 Tax=Burkholderia sp. Tr-862 TaxID=2608331 RepID=UPI0014191D4D|nr:hypothetical protein [Burkholderia sp. Tr-862]NIF40143.1 hypothetical protein [Burkholderia sp. Tr-862]
MSRYEYCVADSDRTSGWAGSGQGVNEPNSYGMRPIEVAAQAADAEEFRMIFASPEFDPTLVNPFRFAEVGRMVRDYQHGAEERYAAIRKALSEFNDTFPYDEERRCRVRAEALAPVVASLPKIADGDSPAARAAKARFIGEHAPESQHTVASGEQITPRPAASRMRM